MSSSAASSAHFDYLQHLGASGVIKTIPAPPPWDSVPASVRRQFEITSYGQFIPLPGAKADDDKRPPEMLPLVTALGAYGVPLVVRLAGDEHGVHLSCGTWNVGRVDSGGVLVSALRSQFPSISLSVTTPTEEAGEWDGCMAMGVPTVTPQSLVEAPIDRVIRGLPGRRWAILTVAEPVDDAVPGLIRTSAMAESRSIAAEQRSDGGPNPTSDQYIELLKDVVKHSLVGASIGMWRYCTYLVAAGSDLPALAGLWRSMFTADEPSFEPMQTLPCRAAAAMANGWMLPDMEGERGPGQYHRLLELTSIVTSAQLAQLIQFPKLDTPGIMIRPQARFDTAAANVAPNDEPLRLGTVLLGSQSFRTNESPSSVLSGPAFEIKTNALTKHVFVAGTTGSGKTNTIRALLKSLAGSDRRFMVIEPAKTEYRSFIKTATMAGDLRVYTLGNAMVSPFFLNPFEAAPGTPVSMHLDLLKSLFTASFGMWTPLPQILERCLQAVYLDKGWDLVGGGNSRTEDGQPVPPDAWPTLAELIEKVEEVLPTLGYEEKISSDMRASLTTRLNGLCRGAKGRMLNTRTASSFKEALRHNVVFELEAVADDDEKAFLMGLLMIRLFEERRAEQRIGRLKHLLVIEEAHRILSNVSQKGGEESANPRAKAVETFANLLAEMRAYGQGFVIADQVPVKLAPDVIKNSNLKIAHRIVAGDDREALAGSMAMDEAQKKALSILTVGQAAVFQEGEDAPLLVAISAVPESDAPWPSDTEVAGAMKGIVEAAHPKWASEDRWRFIAEDAAGQALEDGVLKAAYNRFVLAALVGDPGAEQLLPLALDQAEKYRPFRVDAEQFRDLVAERAAAWYAERRGRQRGSGYVEVAEFKTALEDLQGATINKNGDFANQLNRVAEVGRRMFARTSNPYLGCASICPDRTCYYRGPVSDILLTVPAISSDWLAAIKSNDPLAAERKTLNRYATRLIGPGGRPATRPASLCLAQHLLRLETPETQQGMIATPLKAAQ